MPSGGVNEQKAFPIIFFKPKSRVLVRLPLPHPPVSSMPSNLLQISIARSISIVRSISILSLATVLVVTHYTAALCQNPTRVWKDASGKFEVIGFLVNSDDSMVTLHVDGKGEIKVPVEKLCDFDQRYIKGLQIVEQDEAQFRLVMAHLERFRESPTAVMEILDAIHENYPDAPYAAAMLGVAYAADRADYRTAAKYLRLASRSIESRQKVLGNECHQLTEIAVNNNLAIAHMKLGKGDKAVKLFEKNVEITANKIDFCTYHNATLMLEGVNLDSSLIALPPSSRKSLVKLLATTPPATPGFQVPPNFLYLLEWNQPLSESYFFRIFSGEAEQRSPAEKRTSVSGSVFQSQDALTKRGYRPHLQGTGFLVTPDLVVTNRNVVQSADNNLSYTITQYTEDGEPTLVGGSVVKWSPVQEEDIAIIRLDQKVQSEPLRIIDDEGEAVVGSEITVLGFPDAFKSGEHLLASGGKIEAFNASKSWFSLSASLLRGNSGGPCVDTYGNVCGVAFETDRDELSTFANRNKDQYNRPGIAVSASPLIQFIKSVDPTFEQLPPRWESALNRQELAEQIRPSVFLVKSWKSPLSRQGNGALTELDLGTKELQNLESATLRENRLYPDVWCFYCKGTGGLRCPNSGCIRGSIEIRKPVVIGVDPNTGRNIYRINRYNERCKTCNGHDGIKCPHCIGGKLKEK